jgi:PPOX class probable F420-dependent enzyme
LDIWGENALATRAVVARGAFYRGRVPRTIASTTFVDLAELLGFVRDRHHFILVTTRRDGRPQVSPVSGGVDGKDRLVIATYPGRAKAINAQRDARVSVRVLSDDFDGSWVQVDGEAEVLHMPLAEEALVDYYRCIAGEHPDWDQYRAAMRTQGKSLIRITPTRWGPIATGGFPAEVAARLDG